MKSLFEVLSEKAAMEILLFILEHEEPTTRTEIIKNTNLNKNTIIKRIKELVDAGLIREEPAGPFPYTLKLYLTEKGRKVAEILKQLKELEE